MMSLGRYKQAGSIGKYVQFASDIFSHTGCAHDGAVPRVDVGEPTLKKLTYQISPQSHAFGTVARGAIDSMSGVFGTTRRTVFAFAISRLCAGNHRSPCWLDLGAPGFSTVPVSRHKLQRVLKSCVQSRRSKLRMQPRSDNGDRTAIAVVGWICDKLIIEGHAPREDRGSCNTSR